MTNDTNRRVRPRLVPDHALPPYAYVPGQLPHPVRDPGGHSFGPRPEDIEPPDPERWWACCTYLYGIDLFNHGYYWEAHEVWEGLWNACGRRGAVSAFFQGLIALAAAGLKVRLGNVRGVTGHAKRAAQLFDSTATAADPCEARYMGLDLQALLGWADDIAARPPVRNDEASRGAVVFDFVLWPE